MNTRRDIILSHFAKYMKRGDAAFAEFTIEHTGMPKMPKFVAWNGEGANHLYLWPGGSSGATVGAGIDLGYQFHVFDSIIASLVEPGMVDDYEYLKHNFAGVVGKKAEAVIKKHQTFLHKFDAYLIAKHMEDLESVEKSINIKFLDSVYRFCNAGVLPNGVTIACMSLFYNRGLGRMYGDRYIELNAIKAALRAFDNNTISIDKLKETIATNLIKMRRLWVGKELDGLLTRRVSEAYMCYRVF
jgi:hypothetical protein